MCRSFNVVRKVVRNFRDDTSGVILTESLLVLPVLSLFAFGIMEFGSILWQRQQVQVGVRDAARYWSRCRPDFSNCSLQIARNIAFYGNPTGTGPARVPGWTDAAELTLTPATPPTSPVAADTVSATGSVVYQGSPLFNFVLSSAVTIEYTHMERYIGW